MNPETAIFAGGCFWCIEVAFEKTSGVIAAVNGYIGGKIPDPTYEQVSTGMTGHREAVEVTYDPGKISYAQLLEIFWQHIDPTDPGGQFADRGSQYTTAIYYLNDNQRQGAEASKAELDACGKFDAPVATEILPATKFYPAEDYHQDYALKNAAHYEAYNRGSGRAGYIEKTWAQVPAVCPVRPRPPR